MTHFARLPAVERRLSGGRSLVHVVNGAKPVELAGSAPVVWELLDIFSNVDELAAALNQRYTDEPACDRRRNVGRAQPSSRRRPDRRKIELMDALFAIARFGLPSAAEEPITVDIAGASSLLTGIANHRLTGVAVDAMETGALVLDDDTAADLVTRHDAAMTQTLRAELAMLRVVEALTFRWTLFSHPEGFSARTYRCSRPMAPRVPRRRPVGAGHRGR